MATILLVALVALVTVSQAVFLDCLDCSVGDPLVIGPCMSDSVEGQCVELTEDNQCPEGTSLCFADQFDCGFSIDDADWDFTGLDPASHGQHADPVYNFTDEEGAEYIFQICGVVYPSQTNYDECMETESGSGPAPAFKIVTAVDGTVICHRLGAADITDNSEWILLESTDPVAGLELAYSNGDDCGDGERLSFHIHFECIDEPVDPDGFHFDPFNVSDPCVTQVGLRTVLGCPTECRSANVRMCNSKGGCEYSEEDGAFCDCTAGFSGDTCEHEDEPFECMFDFGNAHWDLTDLATDDILEYETDDTEFPRFHYFFRICGEIDPSELTYDECADLGSSPAFLVKHMEDETRTCERLGGSQLEFETDAMWGLLVPEEPEAGVTLTYLDGDACGDGEVESLTIRFECFDNIGPDLNIHQFTPPDTEGDEELCDHQLGLQSVHACPRACHSSNGHMCNSLGGCSFNADTKTPFCECADGWQEPTCETRIEMDCTFMANGAHWDLTGFRLVGDHPLYNFDDANGASYMFQVCGLLDPSDTRLDVCSDDSIEPAPAFRVDADESVCERLGGLNLPNGDAHFELLNSEDPVDGVVLVYENGDPCTDGSQESMTFTIKFECANDRDEFFHEHVNDDDENEGEETCSPELAIRTVEGCPQECISSNSEMCNSHGGCEFDESGAHCVCAQEWDGPTCETPPPDEEEEMIEEFDCKFAFDDAMWDFTGLRVSESRNDQPYYFHDIDQNVEYFFDICGVVQPGQTGVSACAITEGGSGPSPAFVVFTDPDNGDKTCHRAGNSDILQNAHFSLLLDNRPQAGVILHYAGGDLCDEDGDDGEEERKSFSINFECIDQIAPSFHTDSDNAETACDVEIGLRSFVGCPEKCIDADSHMCNSLGGCAYDPQLGGVYCDCAEGWGGPTCEQEMAEEEGEENEQTAPTTAVTRPPPTFPLTFPPGDEEEFGQADVFVDWNDSPNCPPELALTISRLEIVEWDFTDKNTHTVTCEPSPCYVPSPSGSKTGGRYQYNFARAGSFGFYCEKHGLQCMGGKVFVMDSKLDALPNSATEIVQWKGEWHVDNTCNPTSCCCLTNTITVDEVGENTIDLSGFAHGECKQAVDMTPIKFRIQTSMPHAIMLDVLGNPYTLSLANDQITLTAEHAECSGTALSASDTPDDRGSDVAVVIGVLVALLLIIGLGIWLCCYYMKKRQTQGDSSRVRLVNVGPQHEQPEYAPLAF